MPRKNTSGQLLPIFQDRFGKTFEGYLLFADLCGSTAFKKGCLENGSPELVWISRQLIFLERASGILSKYGGEVIKTIGDEVFAYFLPKINAEWILRCSIEIIQGYENLKMFTGKNRIIAKISIDYGVTYNGSIISSVDFDPIGLPVDRCARLNQIATDNEILISDNFLSKLNSKKKSGINFQQKYGITEHKTDLKGFGSTIYHKIIAE